MERLTLLVILCPGGELLEADRGEWPSRFHVKRESE